jgi:hypothetical protein
MNKKPFVLFKLDNKKKASKAVQDRLKMQMKDSAHQCEWLWEPKANSPEHALSIAVLQRAILDTITPGVSERDRKDALDWIGGSKGEQYEREYALSFSRIVESFSDMSAEEFRAKILAFTSNALISQKVADGFRFQRS